MEILKSYALSFLGLPYIWGGNDPMTGYDCSGVVQEILASVGMDPPGDQTAQTLYDFFHTQSMVSWNKPGIGTLVFYGKSVTQITHVAFMLDQYRTIEAGGGDSTCVDSKSASKKHAFIRIRLVDHRPDRVAMLRPSYSSIGVP